MDAGSCWAVALVLFATAVLLAGLSFSPIPGPIWHVPFIGDTVAYGKNPLVFLFKRFRQYGKVFRVYLFGIEMIVVGSPDLIKGPLESTDAKFELPIKPASEILKVDYVRDDERWGLFRKHMSRSLNVKHLRAGVLPRVRTIAAAFADKWFDQGELTDVDFEARCLLYELAMNAVSGFDLNDATMKEMKDLGITVHSAVFSVPVDLPGTPLNKARAVMPKYMDMLKMVLAARFGIDPTTGGLKEPDFAQLDEPGNSDMTLATFLEFKEANEVPTLDLLARRQLNGVFGASETTGNTLLACLIATAHTPGLIDRLREEQARVLAEHGGDDTASLSYDVLMSQMPLLDATVKETMRVLPASQVAFRKMDADCVIGGHHIRKGTIITVATSLPHVLHVWDGKDMVCELPAGAAVNTSWSEAFQPDRWLEKSDCPPSLHLFGFGSHRCLGVTVANMEIRCILATMLRRGSWRLHDAKPHFKLVPQLGLASGPATLIFTKAPLPAGTAAC